MVGAKRVKENNVDNWLYYIKILERRKNTSKSTFGEKI
jgi:hypothetical protein